MNPSNRQRLAIAWVVVVVAAGLVAYLFKLDPRLWTEIGDRQLRNDQLVRAERSYQRALDIDVDHAPALFGLGWAYLRADLPSQARERFQRAVDVAPDYFGGYRGLAAVDTLSGDTRRAEERLRRAHELAPLEPGVVTDLAGLYMDAGHVDEALSLFERASELAPKRSEYRLAMAEAFLAAGRLPEARQQVEEARGLRTRNRRFAGAPDELLFRATLLEIDQHRAGEVRSRDECETVVGLLDAAEGYLALAAEAGLAEDLLRKDHKRISRKRRGVEEECGPAADLAGDG